MADPTRRKISTPAHATAAGTMLRSLFLCACGSSAAMQVSALSTKMSAPLRWSAANSLQPLRMATNLRTPFGSRYSVVRMMCAPAAEPAAEAAPAPAPAAPAEAEIPPFAKLDVRVGRILEAWEHPDSEKLWCEKIDVGEPEPRQIASGIRAYYATKDDLEGKAVLVVCNLKAAKLGGVESNGMVLCASSEDKSKVEFIEPPAEAAPGERVMCEGIMVEPASPNQVKKKKILEGACADLKSVDNVATYKGIPLTTSAGPCRSPTIATGTIS
eukprot:3153142-Pleurochrysis_carterae.AAC.1